LIGRRRRRLRLGQHGQARDHDNRH
jgi:hypothetical protein